MNSEEGRMQEFSLFERRGEHCSSALSAKKQVDINIKIIYNKKVKFYICKFSF